MESICAEAGSGFPRTERDSTVIRAAVARRTVRCVFTTRDRHRLRGTGIRRAMPRVVVLVIDSGGVGALPDSGTYGDGSDVNTLGNVAARTGGLHLPTFEGLGLGDLTKMAGVAPSEHPQAAVARLRERSRGKDTITGHWEMAGIITDVPFPTYPHGFPLEVVEKFTQIVGK